MVLSCPLVLPTLHRFDPEADTICKSTKLFITSGFRNQTAFSYNKITPLQMSRIVGFLQNYVGYWPGTFLEDGFKHTLLVSCEVITTYSQNNNLMNESDSSKTKMNKWSVIWQNNQVKTLQDKDARAVECLYQYITLISWFFQITYNQQWNVWAFP